MAVILLPQPEGPMGLLYYSHNYYFPIHRTVFLACLRFEMRWVNVSFLFAL